MNICSKLSGVSILTLFLAILIYANDWRQQPPESWTLQNVLQILNGSPWVRMSSTAFSATAVILHRYTPPNEPSQPMPGPSTKSNRLVPLFAAIRLISAKPIRMAYLRQCYFQELLGLGVAGRAIDVKNLTKQDTTRAQQAQDDFAKSNPILMGDSEHIIVSIIFTITNLPDGVSSADVTIINPLEGIMQSDLLPVTFLSTKTGKFMTFLKYLPPGGDGMGAKFLFARTAAGGIPSVVAGDKELRFETRINGKKIEAKFDLSKLVYEGKLEL